jgi:hypothetical protein
VFALFVQVLHGLENPKDPSFDRRYYLWERLCLVKAFVLLLDDPSGEELLVQLFKTLIWAVK